MTNALIIAVLLLVIGFILLGWFLVRIVRRLTFKPVEGKPRTPPPSVGYPAIVIAVILLVCSYLLFWLSHQLRSFHPFAPPSSVARIEVYNQGDPVKSIKVDFYTMDDDGESEVTSFYLSGNSWKVNGQFVKIPKALAYIFNAQNYFKVTDFYGDYMGFKPPGADVPLLGHQTIAGGPVDLFQYIGLFSFLKNSFQTCEFETAPMRIGRRNTYEVVLTDSCEAKLDKIK